MGGGLTAEGKVALQHACAARWWCVLLQSWFSGKLSSSSGELLKSRWRREINKQTAGMPTLLCLSSLLFSFFPPPFPPWRSQPCDNTQRCEIKSTNCWQRWPHSVLSSSPPSLFISCSQAENKWPHQALVRHKLLVVGARLKYGWHVLSEQLCCSVVSATRWHRVVLCVEKSRNSCG